MNVPVTMRGVVLLGHGGPEQLQWRDDLPVPQPGPTDVLIRVGAAGVNNTDVNTRVGWYAKDGNGGGWAGDPLVFPRIQGADVCGTVVAAGGSVDRDRVGDRVLVDPCLTEAGGKTLDSPWYLGSECDGGFAEYVRVASRHAHRVETSLSDAELASFPCSYSTAENLLTRAGVVRSDTVLITGASGGVGSAALQLAKARGATVIVVTTAAKADDLRALGADRIVDREHDLVTEVGANQVDAVVDLVAGPSWPSLLEILRPKGRYAVSGAIAGAIVELDVRTLYLKDLTFYGCTVLEPDVFGNLVTRIERGQIRPLVAQTYPLRDIGMAQEAFEEKRHTGKIVLTVSDQVSPSGANAAR